MAGPEPGAAGPLELLVRPGRVLLPPGEEYELTLMIDVRARRRALQRPPLDLSLVLDKSGSMRKEGKIEHAMQAAKLLVENLSAQDTISIVAYDANVVVLDPQQPAVQKRFLAHWSDEIEPGGYTNLSGGLLAGLAEIRRGRRRDSLARVILITDGLANRGVTEPSALRAIARAAQEDGISVSTIGVGEEFDERILSTLAEAGGGHYTYVPDAEDIPGAVAGQVEGLLPVVCQNLRLSFQLPEGVELIEKVVGDTPHLSSQRGPVAEPGEVTVDLGDLVPDESRSVILYLRVSASSEPSLLVLQSRVDFQLPEEAGRPSFQQHQLRLPVGASVRQSAESVDDVVLDTAWLAGVLDLTYLALQSRDWELAEQALQTIAAQQVKLDALAARGGTEALREHAALLAHYAEEIEHLAAEGTLHDHERRQHGYEELKKDIHYRRYLLLHHRPGDPEEHQH